MDMEGILGICVVGDKIRHIDKIIKDIIQCHPGLSHSICGLLFNIAVNDGTGFLVDRNEYKQYGKEKKADKIKQDFRTNRKDL